METYFYLNLKLLFPKVLAMELVFLRQKSLAQLPNLRSIDLKKGNGGLLLG